MLNSRVLETGVGLIFLFLGFSLLATAIQEFIASTFKLRALTLRAGLKTMLSDGQQGLSFYRELIGHPLISPANNSPSYVSASQFSTTVVHLLSGGGQVPATIPALRIAVQSMPDGPYKTIVLSLLREGETDVVSFERRLQNWFDQSMDRVSGVYKRISQYMSLAIGLVLSYTFQADAIAITANLWAEGSLRTTALASASAAQASAGNLKNVMPYLNDFHFSPIWETGFHFHWTWLAGCFVTGAAVSLGAPFWFDALQTFVNLRGTGPVPQKSVVDRLN